MTTRVLSLCVLLAGAVAAGLGPSATDRTAATGPGPAELSPADSRVSVFEGRSWGYVLSRTR